MEISSFDDFTTQAYLYPNCGGSNKVPKVSWKNVPNAAKSLAIVLHDPDAPVLSAHGWIHWIVFNIDPKVTKVFGNNSQLVIPKGATVAKNSYNEIGYGGPCPPKGPVHRYNLSVVALSKKLDASLANDPIQLLSQIKTYSIDKANVMKTYGRS